MPNSYASYAYAKEEYAGPPVPNSPYVETNGGLFPYGIIEIGFGYGPNDANPIWVNVAADVTQISTRRGRQRILGRFEPGTATIALDNKSGRYSPFNSSSPYYNQIRLGMPVRFRAIWGAVTYTVFYGFVETWPLTWPSANTSTLSVTAVDAMKFLNLKKATSIGTYSAAVIADAPYLWYRMNDAAGSTSITDSGSAGLNLPIHYRSGWPYVSTTVQAIYANPTFQDEGMLVADTDGAVNFGTGGAAFGGALSTLPVSIAPDGAVTVETWYTSGAGAGAAVFGGVTDSVGSTGFELGVDADGNAYVITGSSPPESFTSGIPINDGRPHHLVATNAGTTVTLYVDGKVGVSASHTSHSFAYTQVAVGGHTYSPDPTGVLPTTVGVLDEFAVYTSTFTETQVATHYVAGTTPRYGETTGQRIGYLAGYTSIPTAMQALDTGLSAVQGATGKWLTGTILANMQDQADSEGGDLFIDAAGRLTFFDRAHTTRSPYSQVSLILGDTGAPPEEPYRLDSLAVSYDDQDVYNEVTITPDGMSPQTASDATSQSNYGKRTLAKNSLTASAADAAAQAAAQLAVFKAPLPRIDSVTVNPTDDPTMLFGPVLGFDLLTRVELRRRPKDGAGSTFDQIALLEGIEHRVTKATWETTWRMSSTDAA